MNKMKHLSAVALTALTMAACGNGKSGEAAVDTMTQTKNQYGVSLCCESDCVLIYGITDREGEQSVDLFRGSADDALLDSLAAGQSGFRSAFNVFVACGRADYDDTAHHIILFDAGLGHQAGGQMVERMRDEGIDPEAVEAVCLTHLHPDHIGGLLDEGRVVFPNATLYLSKAEHDSGLGNERWQQVVQAYGSDRVKTFADGETICFDMVKTHVVPGHTPGHTLYEVGSCLIAGDLLHAQDLQLTHPEFCARYDGDPAAARTVRRQTYDQLRHSGLLLCGAHCYDHFISLRDEER